MVSRKLSYNQGLKSRKSIKKNQLASMSGSGIDPVDPECLIKLDGTCLKKGFTLSDVLTHNEERISKYDPERLQNYDKGTVKLLLDLPVYVLKEYKIEHYAYIFDDIFFLPELLKLNMTITDEDQKKYINENNIYDFFRRGVLTYGQTKKRFNELKTEITGAISEEQKKNKGITVPYLKKESDNEIKALQKDLANLNNAKILIDQLKKLCKFPVAKFLSAKLGTRTNPKCKFHDTGDNPNSRAPKPINERYFDTNTNQKGV